MIEELKKTGMQINELTPGAEEGFCGFSFISVQRIR